MKLGLKGKTAIVTGGARGIGKGICECLAREGVSIGIIDKLEDEAEEVSKMLGSEYGVDSIARGADVSDQQSVGDAIGLIIEKLGDVDILVNNAGIFTYSMIEELDEAKWDQTFSVNLKSALFCSKAVIPSMKKLGKGRIINAASVVGFIPAVGEGAYAATKAAVINYTMCLASELGPLNITVNAFAPGIVKTPMSKGLIDRSGEVELRKTPFNRFGEPQEVGDLVVFLASDAAGHITGATIPVANGQIITHNQQDAYKYYNK